jgi:menaquinol-cytochrome c reductase cytochrome b/c subunit
MVDIPEDLLRRSAEAKAKALGVPVEQVLAEMKGEGPPVEPPKAEAPVEAGDKPEPKEMVLEAAEVAVAEKEKAITEETTSPEQPEEPGEEPDSIEPDVAAEEEAEAPAAAVIPEEEKAAAAEAEEPAAAAITTKPEEGPEPAAAPSGNGGGNGKVAGMVSPRPAVPPAGLPEGVRTQRLLTVVKARAIQNVKAEPGDKVNTWPHLMLMEFGALLAITGLLVIMSVVIHSPLLEPANFNATPNPSKAPWYFLGLQELLSYFDPQIAGVMVPLFIGMIGFMFIPYVDKNPSTRPSDRKFAIMLYSIFLAGSATLTIIGVLFRGQGFNFSYPWRDGVFFDDLKDWVNFE